jgi:hypothetical protein
MTYDLDLNGAYGRADAADGYVQAEDLSSKNKVGITLTAIGFGLFGLIKIAEHGNEMDAEAEQVAGKYDAVSPDQAEYVMRRVAGSFAIDDDPTELARTADKVLEAATEHGYSGSHTGFLLDYCLDKGMEVDEAIGYMTAGEATQVLTSAYTEVGEKVIVEAITNGASKVDSLEDATEFSRKLIGQLVQEEHIPVPEDVATLISDVARYSDTTPTSSELIEAVSVLANTCTRTGIPVERAADLFQTLDYYKDTGTDGALALTEATDSMLQAAGEHGVSIDDVKNLISYVDRHKDTSDDTADILATNTVKLIEGMKAYGVSSSEFSDIMWSVDRNNDTGGQTSTEVVADALRIAKGMHENGVSEDDATDIMWKVDRYEDNGGQTGGQVVDGTVKLLDAMKRNGLSKDDTGDLMWALDRYEDTGGQSGADVVDGVVKLMDAMKRDGLSEDDITDIMYAVDRYENTGGQTGAEVVAETVKLMDAMKAYGGSEDDVTSLMWIVDRYEDKGGDTGTTVADNTIRLMEAANTKGLSLDRMGELVKEADHGTSGQTSTQVVDEVLKRL